MGPKGALDSASFARCLFVQVFLSKGAGSCGTQVMLMGQKGFYFYFYFFP
jgi:hypothetical protein